VAIDVSPGAVEAAMRRGVRDARVLAFSDVALLAASSATTATARQTTDTTARACLRAHGWAYGLTALRRQELRVRHPNGLVALCVRQAG
jgi:hypothetical protein